MASKARRKATAPLGMAPQWRWTVSGYDLFGRFLFSLAGAYASKGEAELEAARVQSAAHDTGRIRFRVEARDCTGPLVQKVRALENAPIGRTSGAKGARKSARVPAAATSRPSRMAPQEDDVPPVASKPAKKPAPSAAKAPVVPRGRAAKRKAK